MLELDGSYGSGGGQMLRTALALSTITGISFKMTDIRAKREKPGVKQQHLTGIKALAKICNAKAIGDTLGSREITFIPGKYVGKNETIDIITAGSITLLLQAILLPAMFASKQHTLTIIGGTDVIWSPLTDYLINVIQPQIKRFCQNISITVKKRGYYPKGGGIVEVKINPLLDRNAFDDFDKFKKSLTTVVSPFNLVDTPKIVSIDGNVTASSGLMQRTVAERIAAAANAKLSSLNTSVNINKEYVDTLSDGTGITLWAKCSTNKEFNPDEPVILGVDNLGERGVLAEKVGEGAANKLIKEINSGCCVDEHLADNLIPFMALLPGSQIKASTISDHTKTNIYVVEKFLGKMFEIQDNIIKTK